MPTFPSLVSWLLLVFVAMQQVELLSKVSVSHVSFCWNVKTVLQDINNWPTWSWKKGNSSTPWWQKLMTSPEVIHLISSTGRQRVLLQTAGWKLPKWLIFLLQNNGRVSGVLCQVDSLTYFTAMMTLCGNAIASGAIQNKLLFKNYQKT